MSDRLIRFVTAGVVVAVAAFAAVISFSHVYDLGRAHGQSGTAARLLPLSVDGLILAASLVLLHEARNRRQAPALARWMLALGVGATIAGNVLYGVAYGPLGAIVSAWPAVSFIGAVEMCLHLVRSARSAAEHPADAVRAAVPVDSQSAALAAMRATVVAGNPLSGRQLESRFGLSRAEATQVRRAALGDETRPGRAVSPRGEGSFPPAARPGRPEPSVPAGVHPPAGTEAPSPNGAA